MHTLTQDPLAMAERMVQPRLLPEIPAPGEAELPVIAALGGDVGKLATMTRPEVRAAILALEKYVSSLPGAQFDCPVREYRAPGLYVREMTIPKGVLIVGKIHRHSHPTVISKGRVRVVTESGFDTYEAPCTFVNEPGAKRVILADEETVWSTIHATDETDPEALEASIIASSYDELGVLDAAPQQEKLQ